MRKWRCRTVPANHSWETMDQIVLPMKYRADVLSLEHDTPMFGHLGVKKAWRRVLMHIYWSNVQKDDKPYCRSCHVCQVVGKPIQKIVKDPLIPVPAFEEPFTKVLVDCVGPLVQTKSGNQYRLTMKCCSNRFPEAVPLRNITAKSIKF